MNESLESTSERTASPAQRYATFASEAAVRKWVTWTGVGGTGVLASFFFGFMIYQAIWGQTEPSNWVVRLTCYHYAALVGTPMSAVTAFCIVSLLKVTNGPIEFEALAFKFRGASGPIILWVVCFLSVAIAFRMLWPMAPNQAMQRTASEPATYDLSVCHQPAGCESRFTGLAVADLGSR